MTDESVAARLEYLRGELRAERISYDELVELQGLWEQIDTGDNELLEAAGVPEYVARARDRGYPTAMQTPDGPRSTCCNEQITVTRVVSDVVTYEAENVVGDGDTLEVRYMGRTNPVDSQSFEANCNRCGAGLEVEVEEL